MVRTLAIPRVEIAWDQTLTGVFTIGTSLVGGPDVIPGRFAQASLAFTDETSRTMRASGSRGYDSVLGAVSEGRCSLVLRDPIGRFNPARAGYAAEVLADSPEAYWRLGEASGSTVAADSSGTGRDGTYAGGVTLGEAGAPSSEVDTAARFDGTDDYVTIPDAAAFDFTGTASFTIEAWVKPAALDATFRRVVDKEASGVGGWGMHLHTTSGLTVYRVNGGTVQTAAAPASRFTAGAWHHVAGTYDGTTIRVYVNGVERGTGASGTAIPATAQVVAIGRSTDFGAYFGGTIDDVALYGSALSAARILDHYEAGTLYLGRKLVPGRPVRVTSTHLGIPYGLFFGIIQSIESHPRRDEQDAWIECVDLFEWLNVDFPVIAATGPTTTGAAIGVILDAVGWTGENYRALDTGSSIPDFSADGTDSALDLIQGLLQADLGMFFVDGGGVATYHDRGRRWEPAAAVDTLSGTSLVRLAPRVDLDQIKNRARVTRTGGAQQERTDAASQARYGTRDDPAFTTPYLSDDSQAEGLAAFRVALQKDPRSPARDAELMNRDDADIVRQLAREIGDRVTVAETAGGTAYDGVVTAVQWDIWQGGRFHRASFTVATRPFEVFVIGTSAIGGSHVLGY